MRRFVVFVFRTLSLAAVVLVGFADDGGERLRESQA